VRDGDWGLHVPSSPHAKLFSEGHVVSLHWYVQIPSSQTPSGQLFVSHVTLLGGWACGFFRNSTKSTMDNTRKTMATTTPGHQGIDT
jgi:hypothetical protein